MQPRSHNTLLLLAAVVALASVAAACSPGDPFRSTGSYPIDVFQEMHYNQTMKSQEPPRFLPPEDSYPVEGGYISVREIENIEELPNPLAGDPLAMQRGALLFKQNCSMCHGLTAGGDGYVGGLLSDHNVTRPPAFGDGDGIVVIRDTGTTEVTPGEAFGSISGGVGYMPAFEPLLTEEDRWALVTLIDATVAQRQAVLQSINDVSEEERTLRLLDLRGQL
ncbi:MAG: cytochrome c [Chloroflexota bacterium]|nr:cytochrome c [Chloroflexota bacterium]MDE2883856.1 cytochrome c [Chloroflexota bacterium]